MTTSDQPEPDELEPLEQMQAIADTLDIISKRLGQERKYNRRTRHLAWGMVVTLILDIVLTVVVTLLSFNAYNANITIHRSQLAACMIANENRADEIKLWNFVIVLSSSNPNNNKNQINQLRQFVDTTFAPVNCTQLYP